MLLLNAFTDKKNWVIAALAAIKTKRQFICIEKDPHYYEVIKKRVADFNKNFEPQTLFGNDM